MDTVSTQKHAVNLAICRCLFNTYNFKSSIETPVTDFSLMKIIDIGANLLDDMFKGIYHKRQCHPPDLERVLKRAADACITNIIITCGSVEDARSVHKLISDTKNGINSNVKLHATIGIHPTNALSFSEKSIDELFTVYNNEANNKNNIVCVGECGLDYARLEFAPKEAQIKAFAAHFELAARTGLPMFLHLRDAFDDFYAICKQNRHLFTTAVVHSFDGTVDEAMKLIEDLDLYIGINGCSLKQSQCESVIKTVPLDRLMVESDAPWCEIRQSHFGFRFLTDTSPTSTNRKTDKDKWDGGPVKGRNEPIACQDILLIIARIKMLPVDQVAAVIYETTKRVFNKL